MPSENKTDNYGLNQWSGNEFVKREDFVTDNVLIDTAIKKAQDKANDRNATTLGGKYPGDFAPSGFGLGGVASQAFTDCNLMVKTGWYMNSNMANAPSTDWYIVEGIMHNETHAYQRAIGFTRGVNDTWERTMNGGTWGAWIKQVTTGGQYHAGQGATGGYTFAGELVDDTGIFSDADGDLYLKVNGVKQSPITSANIAAQTVNHANNADTVDGYHLIAQTAIPGSLGNNVICLVYE